MENKNGQISLDEEFMMFATMRYCIGRHTGASIGQAGYIASKYYNKLSDSRLEFAAEDIRKEIGDYLNYQPFSFHYSGTVPCERRFPLEDFIAFASTLDNVEEELLAINDIEVYCESYNYDAEKKFRISKKDYDVRNSITRFDILDLLPWQRLAALFNKKNYKKVTTNFNGNVNTQTCIETYIEDIVKVGDGESGYYQRIPWKFKKVYIDIESIKKSGLNYVPYINEEYIIKIENI